MRKEEIRRFYEMTKDDCMFPYLRSSSCGSIGTRYLGTFLAASPESCIDSRRRPRNSNEGHSWSRQDETVQTILIWLRKNGEDQVELPIINVTSSKNSAVAEEQVLPAAVDVEVIAA
jgi:hypothetical protein